MSAYLHSLKQSVGKFQERPDLRQRVAAWFAGLPEISRSRAFSMSEVEEALKVPGRLLSPVLLALGWRRKRKWTGQGQYPRYWVPPML